MSRPQEPATFVPLTAAPRLTWTRPMGQALCQGLVGGACVALLGWALTGGGAPVAVGLVVFLAALGIMLYGLAQHYPHRTLGLCNRVTFARLVLTCALIPALWGGVPWPVFAVACLAFALDGIDGWAARREGLVSAFGARFDMEVDSFLALVLAILAMATGPATAVIVVLGLPRYLFWAAQVPFPWLAGDLPPRFSRKVICVLQIAALLLALWPGIEPALIHSAVVGVAFALMWSFGRDIHILWSARL